MTPDPVRAEQRSEFSPFFLHVAKGELAFPYCDSCNRFHWYPMKRCPHCQSAAIRWQAVKGVGRLYSWTEVRHQFGDHPTPYIVGIVEFDDAPGLRMVTNIVGVSPAELQIDLPVRARLPLGIGELDHIVYFEPIPRNVSPGANP